jgi:hypothetical protein
MNLSRQMDRPMSLGLLALKQSHSKMYGNISELDRSELRDCGRIILAATSLVRSSVHPLELSDCKPEPSERLLLAASAIVMDDLDQFPAYRLDTLHFDRTIATARLQSENL